MNMIHRFMGCIREYKKPTILTLLCMVGEVAIEVLIPFFTANLVNEIKGGKVQYRTDKAGNVQVIIGKASFDEDKLKQNLLAIFNTIQKARPASVKGVYMKSLTISSTMGPGIHLDISSVAAPKA